MSSIAAADRLAATEKVSRTALRITTTRAD
jgi:hypothetical protein